MGNDIKYTLLLMDDNRDVHEIADSKVHEENTSNVTRNKILTLMDNFIEQLFQIRRLYSEFRFVH